jgi:hypothetical protein
VSWAGSAGTRWKPFNPAANARATWQAMGAADWQAAFSGSVVKTLGIAAREAVHFTSPEISEALRELREIPGIGQVTRASGIPFTTNVVNYGHLWSRIQAGAVSADITDKLNSVLTRFGSEIPGYNQAKEATGR